MLRNLQSFGTLAQTKSFCLVVHIASAVVTMQQAQVSLALIRVTLWQGDSLETLSSKFRLGQRLVLV